MIILKAEDQKLFNDAVAQMVSRGRRRVTIETDIVKLIGLISMVQLALRHPDAAAMPTGIQVREMIAGLIEQIDPDHGVIWQILQKGFDPESDV